MLLGAVVTTLTTSVLAAPNASAAVPHLITKDGVYCLGTTNGNHNSLTLMWNCHDSADQSWYMTPRGSDSQGTYYMITNGLGDCLGIYKGSTASGADASAWECNNNEDQRWYYQKGSDGWGGLVNKHSGMCLGRYNGYDFPGVTNIQWTCNGNGDQLWRLTSF
ncbi:RICIN domain-containing protein [Streptomyces sp. CBMA152]|uniref:RICIN domain-containing protein n=1 Tax=Streptomyces sp. CBMA152 TaxID=1896312 RepID=UPI001CB7171C|nr:RICIN domain-containing protein [Streptomyces sp. CBMA152]MBD0742194.1 hypothetical protein [Streptomyces sp. CBMA152]